MLLKNTVTHELAIRLASPPPKDSEPAELASPQPYLPSTSSHTSRCFPRLASTSAAATPPSSDPWHTLTPPDAPTGEPPPSPRPSHSEPDLPPVPPSPRPKYRELVSPPLPSAPHSRQLFPPLEEPPPLPPPVRSPPFSRPDTPSLYSSPPRYNTPEPEPQSELQSDSHPQPKASPSSHVPTSLIVNVILAQRDKNRMPLYAPPPPVPAMTSASRGYRPFMLSRLCYVRNAESPPPNAVLAVRLMGTMRGPIGWVVEDEYEELILDDAWMSYDRLGVPRGPRGWASRVRDEELGTERRTVRRTRGGLGSGRILGGGWADDETGRRVKLESDPSRLPRLRPDRERRGEGDNSSGSGTRRSLIPRYRDHTPTVTPMQLSNLPDNDVGIFRRDSWGRSGSRSLSSSPESFDLGQIREDEDASALDPSFGFEDGVDAGQEEEEEEEDDEWNWWTDEQPGLRPPPV